MSSSTTSGGFATVQEWWASPPVHIPDGKGGAFKTEMAAVRGEMETIKYLFWHAPDPREMPHNHPWAFRSVILHGGYTEQRFWLDDLGRLCSDERVHREHQVVDVPINHFHNVVEVLPGTVTRMTCGPARPGNAWEYLDLKSLELVSNADPNFRAALEDLNPFLPKIAVRGES